MKATEKFDREAIRRYFQPPAALVEKHIAVKPFRLKNHTLSAYRLLSDYLIRDFGKGIPAAEQIIRIIFRRKFQKQIDSPFHFWNNLVAVTVTCELHSVTTGLRFEQTKPQTLEDIDPELERKMEEERKQDVRRYTEQIKKGQNLGNPLYISGQILNLLGAGTDEKAIYMMDGARRIMAGALTHQRYIDIILLLEESEFPALLKPGLIQRLTGEITNLQWFNNYQSIPLVRIKGQRSLQRFDLMDLNLLRDSVVFDFGSNIGQSCLKAIMAGAKKVVGFDIMNDTLRISRRIQQITGIPNLEYCRIDFNHPGFNRKIDKKYPGPCDFSFFFSI
jgi:hypothetical protein